MELPSMTNKCQDITRKIGGWKEWSDVQILGLLNQYANCFVENCSGDANTPSRQNIILDVATDLLNTRLRLQSGLITTRPIQPDSNRFIDIGSENFWEPYEEALAMYQISPAEIEVFIQASAANLVPALSEAFNARIEKVKVLSALCSDEPDADDYESSLVPVHPTPLRGGTTAQLIETEDEK